MVRGLVVTLVLLGTGLGSASKTVEVKDGDLYLQDGGKTTRLTSYGLNQGAVLSPDGRWVAYLSEPQWSAAYLKTQEGDGMLTSRIAPALNVWLLDLQTRQARRIAGQPQEARKPNTLYRGGLAWSADSARLSWQETPIANSTADGGWTWMTSTLVTFQQKTGNISRFPLTDPFLDNVNQFVEIYPLSAGRWLGVNGLGVVLLAADGSQVTYTPPAPPRPEYELDNMRTAFDGRQVGVVYFSMSSPQISYTFDLKTLRFGPAKVSK